MTEKSAIRILIIDDDDFTLKLLNRMLANLGFPAATCDSGRAALEWIDSAGNHPDLILLDLNMPEMDGIEFVRKLVERRYTGSLILVSGEDERVLQTAENLVHAHGITLLGSLRKPVTPEDLAMPLGKWSPPSHNHPPQTTQADYSANELRAAIANGELVNYYQPKVDVASGRVVGVEALVRWQHPADGIVLPIDFIGMSEEHGLIDDLARTVLASAFAQARLWQESGLVLQLAVNVSIDNLASLNFADYVTGQAAAAGIPPQQVVLEVAEGRIMKSDMRAPLETLARLRLKRFRLSIDDFGSGHSSMTQLRDIPFDELKIDRSFVHGASTDGVARAKYEASLSIARQLEMEVVAEGVEDRDDWDFLRRTKCDLAQGYFIARPMPAADLPGWTQCWQMRMRREFAVTP
ncbi:MAG: EAL domain-containing response regulator [Sideroxyarcus sp.]|nr:EAL domain-containing response regulator [Sideroxyarcus sp.]